MDITARTLRLVVGLSLFAGLMIGCHAALAADDAGQTTISSSAPASAQATVTTLTDIDDANGSGPSDPLFVTCCALALLCGVSLLVLGALAIRAGRVSTWPTRRHSGPFVPVLWTRSSVIVFPVREPAALRC